MIEGPLETRYWLAAGLAIGFLSDEVEVVEYEDQTPGMVQLFTMQPVLDSEGAPMLETEGGKVKMGMQPVFEDDGTVVMVPDENWTPATYERRVGPVALVRLRVARDSEHFVVQEFASESSLKTWATKKGDEVAEVADPPPPPEPEPEELTIGDGDVGNLGDLLGEEA